MKAFNLTPDYVLYEMSYVNVIMYGATLPVYDSKRKDRRGGGSSSGQEVIKADDPANRARVRQLIDSFD